MSHTDYIRRSEGLPLEEILLACIPIVLEVMDKVTLQHKWDYAYAEGKWTVKELIQHLIDCERIFSYRALHIARQDTSVLSGFDENLYVDNSKGECKEPQDLREEYITLMKSVYYQFKGFTTEALALKNQMAHYVLSVEEIGRLNYGHTLHHIDILLERYLDKK
ncbi:DinB family protein [Myroides odoratimimus]|uniref:DinB family protein n=1 Tax=Myroides TaxID=76831 RepID=UPI002578FAE1|nr:MULTISPECIES: DinB family protein [Myroides]MDM1509769.1 DinB family protein [Myroides odoratimimus]MDM1679714.1 DinB family protein [Myroides odoratimimus]MEC4035577.1 DinB family protein [Myroides odoratimimus]MEC4094221.1 DinB family protein [Myroides odoratimimus]